MTDFPAESARGPLHRGDSFDAFANPYVSPRASDSVFDATVVDEEVKKPSRRILLPLVLFVASCVSTFAVYFDGRDNFRSALIYSSAVMFILTAHEMGHFLQAVRYKVPASLPYFIPMPASPIGTMGAVIAMRGHMGHRKALFDIGISGPLAGLIPSLIFSVIGIQWSVIGPLPTRASLQFGEPLLFSWLVHRFLDYDPATQDVFLHPLAYAGWVGFLITSLNLFPVGQLDGGHILYALLRRRSYPVALLVLAGAAIAMVLSGAYNWLLMVFLVYWMGPFHPPTANDEEPLGVGRAVLGVATLAFVIVGFTPRPFYTN